jgi:hypothetical protein
MRQVTLAASLGVLSLFDLCIGLAISVVIS